MNKKPKLEGIIWNYASTSTRERLVSYALIRLQNKDSSRAPFQGLDISLAKKNWDELRADIQKQIKKLLRVATVTIQKDDPDIHRIMEKGSTAPLQDAIRKAVADAIIAFALRNL